MKATKFVAIGLATALAAGGIGIAAGGAAQAYGPASSALNCRLYFYDNGTGTSPSVLTENRTLTQSPTSPEIGDTVTLTLTGDTGPSTGPVGVEADGQTVRAAIDLTGAETTTVNLVSSAAYPTTAIDVYTPLGAYSASGTYTASAAGSVTAALKQLKFDDDAAKPGYSGYNVDTYCADAADADFKATGGTDSANIVDTYNQTVPLPHASVTGVTSNSAAVPASTPRAFRTGDVITVSSGTNTLWTPNTTINATICGTATFIGCAPSYVGTLAGTVTSDGSGAIPPSTLTASLATFVGSYYVALYEGASVGSATNRVAIPVTLLGPRTLNSSTAQGAKGTTASVTGANWYPGETVTFSGAATGTTTADSAGAISKTVTLSNGAATTLTATGVGGSANTPLDVVDLNGAFTKSASGVYLTKAVTVKPSAVTSDTVSTSIAWGDGKTIANASKTVASSHTYAAAGTYTIVVTLHGPSTFTATKNLGTVKVTKDTFKPLVTLTTPKSPTKASSWTTIKGKASDKGLGVDGVGVLLVEKNKSNGKWYYYNGAKWVKTTSKAKAERKAAVILDTSIVSGAWSVKVKKPAKGTLYLAYVAVDKAGNTTGKTKTQKLTK